MNAKRHEIGDFVQFNAPNGMMLKKGLVVEDKKDSFCVQWMSYNKLYFDGVNVMIESLSKNYLLTKTSYHRTNSDIRNIVILNKARQDVLG